MVRNKRTAFTWVVVALVVVLVVLLGPVKHEGVQAAGGELQSATNSYRLVENWPELPPRETYFGTMSGIAIDDDGIVYAVSRDRGTVWKWDKSGRYLGSWGPGVAVWSHNMRFDPRENVIWVADRDGQLVKKYSLDGELLMTLGTFEEAGNDEGHFHGPADMVIAENGDIFVADGYFNTRVVKFNQDGKYLGQVGSRGRGKGQFGVVHALAGISSSGRIFVTDLCGYGNPATPGRFPCQGSRTVVVDTDLNWIDEWEPRGTMLVDGDTIYTFDGQGGRLLELDARTGRETNSIPIENALPDGQSACPCNHQIVMDEDGDIYTVDEALDFANTAQRRGGNGAVRRYTRGE